MAVKNRADTIAQIVALITSNNNKEVTAARLRQVLTDFADSFQNKVDDHIETLPLTIVTVAGSHDYYAPELVGRTILSVDYGNTPLESDQYSVSVDQFVIDDISFTVDAGVKIKILYK